MKVDIAADRGSTSEVVEVSNPAGSGRFVLVCEHASNFIPPEFGDLGLDAAAIGSHIAWDPGALEVARRMSALLDAPLVAQRVSRLVYDCNRPPEASSAIPSRSEIYEIPGNSGLSAADREARVRRVYIPFRETLSAVVERRQRGGRAPILVTVHSFTPVYEGVRREVDIGILHDVDARFADAILRLAEAETGLVVRRNAPYGPEDGVTHTLAEQALPRRLLNVMIEIRNDLISDVAAQAAMAQRLAAWLRGAAEAFADSGDGYDRPGTRDTALAGSGE